jgi:hypothetical protein
MINGTAKINYSNTATVKIYINDCKILLKNIVNGEWAMIEMRNTINYQLKNYQLFKVAQLRTYNDVFYHRLL